MGLWGAVVAKGAGAACLSWELVDRDCGGTCSLSVLPRRTRGGSTARCIPRSRAALFSFTPRRREQAWRAGTTPETRRGPAPLSAPPTTWAWAGTPGESRTRTRVRFSSVHVGGLMPCLSNQAPVTAPPVFLPDLHMSSAAKSWRSLQER